MDRATGEIALDSGERIDPSLTEGGFRASALGASAQHVGGAPPWAGYKVGPVRIDGKDFLVTLRFDGPRLAMVELFAVSADTGGGWDDWSEAAELARKAEHDAWLARALGAPPYAFPWGEVTSSYDPRGGYSSIVIRYA